MQALAYKYGGEMMATKSTAKSTVQNSSKRGCNCGCGKSNKNNTTTNRQVESGTEMCSSNRATRTRYKATTNTKSMSKSSKTR